MAVTRGEKVIKMDGAGADTVTETMVVNELWLVAETAQGGGGGITLEINDHAILPAAFNFAGNNGLFVRLTLARPKTFDKIKFQRSPATGSAFLLVWLK